MTSLSNNKRIAKNTLLLYIRHLLIMAVSLYTSRVILITLGVTDYGIYNVVGGVVTMFSFLTSTMASASQRYLSYDLGNNNDNRLKETFSLIFLTYVLIAFVTIVLTESIAVWFLNNKMTIPQDRMFAANWVLQFSILTYIANLFSAPYLSVIISHEKMNVYAYISIVDVLMKLLVVYLLSAFTYDKLILYSILLFFSSLITTSCYALYCRFNFAESHYVYFYDWTRLKEMLTFAWWNMIGTVANLLRGQGINILLNMFFNPTINAARGVAYQVNSAVKSFANNFYTAVRPQIYKSYAAGEKESMLSLILMSSRLAFYLLLLISLPIIINVDQILDIWLINPPRYATLFVQIVLFTALIEVFSFPLGAGMQATGNIKFYQIVVSGFYLLNIPISYYLLSKGLPPETVMYVNLILVIIDIIPRLWFCKKNYNLPMKRFVFDVLLKVWLIALTGYVIGHYLHLLLNSSSNLTGLLISVLLHLCSLLLLITTIGINKTERKKMIQIITRIIHR